MATVEGTGDSKENGSEEHTQSDSLSREEVPPLMGLFHI